VEPLDHTRQEPLETDAHRAADPPPGDSLEQESFNERALLPYDHLIFWIEDKGPATLFTALVLFPGMDMTVSFVPG
jgi:hypothetical protein